MAALGAAAGAFEGDNAREEQRARRAGLGLQAASLAQQDRQFNQRQALDREKMAAVEKENTLRRGDRINELAMDQFNTDRRMRLDEKKVALDQDSTIYQRGRNEKQDAWKQALDEQEMQAKQLDMTFQKERLSKFKILAEQERQTIAERKRLSQTALASAMKIGMESGGVVPLSVVQAVAKETGIPFQGMYFAPDGSFVSDVLKDGKTVQEVTPANVQAAIMRSMPGVFGEEAAKDLVTERRDRARYDSQFKRDALKAGAVELSKAGERLLNIRLGRIERERSDILKELKPDDAKELLGDKEYQKLKDRLVQLDKDEDAAVYSAYGETPPAPYSAYGETPPAPSGAQGGGAGIGYTEQQINELGELKVQALREANGDKAKALDIFKQKKKQWELSQVKKDDESGGGEGGSKRQVDPNLKALAQKALADAGGDKEKAAQLYAQYRTGISKQGSVEQPVVDAEPYRSRFGPRTNNVNVGSKAASFGHEPGTTEYWRDMPRGQATGMSKREIGFARRDILKRLEAAYRKGPKGRDEAAKIKAELDAFNEQYPP